MASPKDLTATWEWREEQRKASLELRQQLDFAGELVSQFEKEGMGAMPFVQDLKIKSDEFKLDWDMREYGISQEDRKSLWQRGKEVAGGTAMALGDLFSRMGYAAGTVTREIFENIAPDGSPEGEALDDLRSAISEGQWASGNIAPWNPESIARLTRGVWNLFTTPQGQMHLKKMGQNMAAAGKAGSLAFSPTDALAAMATGAKWKDTGLSKVWETVTAPIHVDPGDEELVKLKQFPSDYLATRGAKLGPSWTEMAELWTGNEQGAVNPILTSEVVTMPTAAGPIEVDMPRGAIAQMLGTRIGFTDDGEGWFSFKKDGLFDLRFEDFSGFALDVATDVATYLTGGTSKFGQALNFRLSREGLKVLQQVEKKEIARRATIFAGLTDEAEREAMRQLERTMPARMVAENFVATEARRDPRLIVRPYEVRFMGVPVVRLGRKPGEESLAKSLIKGTKGEELLRSWRNALHRHATPEMKGIKEAIDGVAALGQSIRRAFQADIFEHPQWLNIRSRAEQLATLGNARVKNGLTVAEALIEPGQTFDNAWMQRVIDNRIVDPNSPFEQRLVMVLDEIDAEYRKLAQVAVKPVKRETVEILAQQFRMNGMYDMAERLERMLKQRVPVPPPAAGTPGLVPSPGQALATAAGEGVPARPALGPGSALVPPGAIDPAAAAAGAAEAAGQQVAKDMPVQEFLRSEIFLDNSALQLDSLMHEITPRLGSKAMSKADDIWKVAAQHAKNDISLEDLKKLDPIFQELVPLMRAMKDPSLPKHLQNAAGRQVNHLKRKWKAVENMRAELMFSTGPQSVMSLLPRSEMIELLEASRRRSGNWLRVPKLNIVDNPILHTTMRAQQVYNKIAGNYMLSEAHKLAKNDAFAREWIERGLISVGSLERHKNVNLDRVTRVLEGYVTGVKGLKHGEPIAGPMTRALGELKTLEEKQLFFRKWLFGEDIGIEALNKGHAASRFWHAMDLGAGGAGEKATFSALTKDLGEDVALRLQAETSGLREVLAQQGLNVEDLLGRAGVLHGVYRDTTRWGTWYGLKKSRGRWVNTMAGDGPPLPLPEPFLAQLRRMARMPRTTAGDESVSQVLRTWDRATNLIKTNQTVLFGFPAHQMRNLYGNITNTMASLGLAFSDPSLPVKSAMFAIASTDPKLAVTMAGKKAALRNMVMREVSSKTVRGAPVRVEDVEKLVRDYYSPYPKITKGITPRQEAQKITEFLNQNFLVDDYMNPHTNADILREMTAQRVALDPTILAEYAGAQKQLLANPHSKRWRNAVMKAEQKLLRSNGMFEQFSRMHLFSEYVARGLGYEEAGRRAVRDMVDYGRLAPAEKMIFQRVIPYYTFYSKSVPLWLRMAVTRPGYTATQYKLMREMADKEPLYAFGSEPNERVVLYKDGTATLIDNIDLPYNTVGLMDWVVNKFSGDLANEAAADKSLREMRGLLHPAIQGVLLAGSQYSLYFGEKQYRKKSDELGKLLAGTVVGDELEKRKWMVEEKGPDGKVHYYFPNGTFFEVLNLTGFSRLLSNFEQGSAAARGLADGELTAALRWLTGIKVEEIDMAESQRERRRKAIRVIEEELVRRGYKGKAPHYYWKD